MSKPKKPKNIKSKGKKPIPAKPSAKEETEDMSLPDVDFKKFLGCGG
ncbi:MAG: hypothetical protein JXQ96_06265 [Cyclobacteriaceae bacterium]